MNYGILYGNEQGSHTTVSIYKHKYVSTYLSNY